MNISVTCSLMSNKVSNRVLKQYINASTKQYFWKWTQAQPLELTTTVNLAECICLVVADNNQTRTAVDNLKR